MTWSNDSEQIQSFKVGFSKECWKSPFRVVSLPETIDWWSWKKHEIFRNTHSEILFGFGTCDMNLRTFCLLAVKSWINTIKNLRTSI